MAYETIVRRKVDELIPYARNSRTHDDAQVAQIAASIKEFGWTNPVLIDGENGIIAGHGRVLAARKLKMNDVPCIELAGMSDTQRQAYIIADNRLALNAGWDNELLAVEFAELADSGFDTLLTGFSQDEIDSLLRAKGTEGKTDPDAVPELQTTAVSQVGQVWLLGSNHRLACGDCTDPSVVDLVLNGVKPHLMVTDPPYGVDYDANWRNEADRANGKPYGARAVGKVKNDDRADWREAWALFPGDVAYVWHAGRFASEVQQSLTACNFEIRSQIIWAKPRFAISRGHYHWQHEPCWYAVRKKATATWVGDRSQTTLWSIPHNKSETGHSTQKPVECMLRPILNNSSPGQAVYEPFSGSGTTIMAAEKSGRLCYAIELNPLYVDMSIRRWQEFTGNSAILESTGQTFDEVAA